MGALPAGLEILVLDSPAFESHHPTVSVPSITAPNPSSRLSIHLQKLIIQGPYINGSIRLDLLRRCPNLEVLRLYIRENTLDPCSRIAKVLLAHCPRLTAARFDGRLSDLNLSLLIGSSAAGWKTFMFEGAYGQFGPPSSAALLKHAGTIENVRLGGCTGFTSANIQQLLCSAPNLRRFQGISIDRQQERDLALGVNDLVRSEWVCLSLESFACRISRIPRPDLKQRTNGRPLTGSMHSGTLEDSYRLQRRVYAQLGRLVNLRHLVLGGDIGVYDEEDHDLTAKERTNELAFFNLKQLQLGYQYKCLSMTLESGLHQLRGLREMQAVVLEGMAVGFENPGERDWQKEHWPLLDTSWLFVF